MTMISSFDAEGAARVMRQIFPRQQPASLKPGSQSTADKLREDSRALATLLQAFASGWGFSPWLQAFDDFVDAASALRRLALELRPATEGADVYRSRRAQHERFGALSSADRSWRLRLVKAQDSVARLDTALGLFNELLPRLKKLRDDAEHARTTARWPEAVGARMAASVAALDHAMEPGRFDKRLNAWKGAK